jgi:hypothetical protein
MEVWVIAHPTKNFLKICLDKGVHFKQVLPNEPVAKPDSELYLVVQGFHPGV